MADNANSIARDFVIHSASGGEFGAFRRQMQMRLLSAIDDTIAAQAQDAIISNFAAVKKAGADVQTASGGRRGRLGLDIIGAFAGSPSAAFGWHLRANIGDGKAVNAGIFWRRYGDDLLLGANAFADYDNSGSGAFWRYSLGAELRHKRFAAAANYYIPLTDGKSSGDYAVFSRRGYDVNVRVNIPQVSFVKARADYYRFGGKYGIGDESGIRIGAEVHPAANVRVGVFYDNGGEGLGGDISYAHTINEKPVVKTTITAFDADLFAPVRREHSQRIAERAPPAFRAPVTIDGSIVVITVEGSLAPVSVDAFAYNGSVFLTNFSGIVGTLSASGGGVANAYRYSSSNSAFSVDGGGVVRFRAAVAGAASAVIVIDDDIGARTPAASITLFVAAVAVCDFVRGCPALGVAENDRLRAQLLPPLPVAREMIVAGMNIHSFTSGNTTGSYLAYFWGGFGYRQLFNLLAESGADVNFRATGDDLDIITGLGITEGIVPLDMQNRAERLDLSPIPLHRQLLLDNGARCNLACNTGQTNLQGEVCTRNTEVPRNNTIPPSDCAP